MVRQAGAWVVGDAHENAFNRRPRQVLSARRRPTPPPAQFSVDNFRVLNLLSAMAQSEEKLVTPASLVVDVVLVAAFFAFLWSVLRSHVPSNNPKMIALWAAVGASCLSAVFWLALQMFRVVLKAQLAAGRK